MLLLLLLQPLLLYLMLVQFVSGDAAADRTEYTVMHHVPGQCTGRTAADAADRKCRLVCKKRQGGSYYSVFHGYPYLHVQHPA